MRLKLIVAENRAHVQCTQIGTQLISTFQTKHKI